MKIIGVDLGGTNTRLGLIDDRGNVSERRNILTGYYKTKDRLLDALSLEIKMAIENSGLTKDKVLGLGIGIPGLIDHVKGIARKVTNIPGWEEVPLKEMMEKRLGIVTFIDNDVNAMALGEYMFGAGRNAENLICITLGTGVGGGIIINGNLYRGSTLSAGEIGHLSIEEDGPRCICGGFGCLERFVGNRFIVESTVRKIKEGRVTKIDELVQRQLRKVTPEIINKAVQAGDRLAIEIWEEVGRHIGAALASVINLLDPDRIVIGGGVAQAGKVLFDVIKKTVRERAMPIPGENTKIVPAELGEDAGIIGASALVRAKLLRNN